MPSNLWNGRIHRSVADEGYGDLRSIYDGSSPATASTAKNGNSATNKGSKANSKLEASQHLFATSARTKNAVDVLEELCTILNDPTSSKSLLKRKSMHLKKYIIPMLSSAADSMNDAAKTLAPIARVEYIHNRKESKRKKEVIDPSNSRMSPELQLIHDYNTNTTDENKENQQPNSATPPKKKTRSANMITPTKVSEEGVTFQFPFPPKSGKEYSKVEAVRILLDHTKERSKERGKAKAAIVAHNKSHGVNCGTKTIDRLITKHKKGQPILDEPWNEIGGRPQKCTDAEIKEIAAEMEVHQGKAYDKKDVADMLQKKHTEKLEKAGMKAILDNNLSRQTVDNYTAMLADQPNISIAASTVSKSRTRFAAENSIRGSVAFLALIGATHFIPIEKEDADVRAELNTVCLTVVRKSRSEA